MQAQLDKLIHDSKGKFFSVTFRKADGTIRVANGKDKYFRLLKGGVSHSGETATPFIDRNKDSWISARKDSVIEFRCGNTVVKF